MDKIQLVTQPEKDSDAFAEGRSLQKLKNLVSDYQPETKNQEDGAEGEKRENKGAEKETKASGSDKNGSHGSQGKNSYDNVHQNDKNADEDPGETKEEEKEGDSVEYDDDGFEIPPGKIPLDGHFSTSELSELVKLSKKGGILNDGINIEILESNQEIGDKVVMSEESNKDKLMEENKKGKSDGGQKVKDKVKNDNSDDLDNSDSIDPRRKQGTTERCLNQDE